MTRRGVNCAFFPVNAGIVDLKSFGGAFAGVVALETASKMFRRNRRSNAKF